MASATWGCGLWPPLRLGLLLLLQLAALLLPTPGPQVRSGAAVGPPRSGPREGVWGEGAWPQGASCRLLDPEGPKADPDREKPPSFERLPAAPANT